jgi:hypothetical protein
MDGRSHLAAEQAKDGINENLICPSRSMSLVTSGNLRTPEDGYLGMSQVASTWVRQRLVIRVLNEYWFWYS